ncbi:MAG: glycosyltransferase family 2 protein [Bacteroidia bacterium]|nr:glycosyltransferase [Bacteroidia bacterium]MDW8134304.1 glycosyltransferase family 2 protein [Bacteroidia bacterium]
MGPRLSIITVTYQAESTLPLTLLSTANQSWRQWEHIFVDGGSTDGTLNMIEAYLAKAPAGQVISEKDKGIYDAMNKGLQRARGEYVVFLNSGDSFWDESTLERLFSDGPEGMDILYGDHRYVDEKGQILSSKRRARPYPHGKLSVSHFRTGMSICHQALFVRREKAPLYDLSYTLAADLDWTIRLLQQPLSTYDSGKVLIRYLIGGVSARRLRRYIIERTRILYKHFGMGAVLESFWAVVKNHLRGGYPSVE